MLSALRELSLPHIREKIRAPAEKRGNFCPRTTEFMVSMALIPVLALLEPQTGSMVTVISGLAVNS